MALLLRVFLIMAPALPGGPPVPIFAGMLYPGDHDDFVRWGMQATDRGLLTLYDEPPPRHDMRVWDRREQRWGITQRAVDRVCNYPPLSTYLLYLSGLVFKLVSPDRLINTPISLGLFTFWSVLGDFLLAWGCAALAARLRPGSAGPLTYAIMLLAPPFWWDSVIWAQTDSVLLAPAAWMLYAMLRGRWILAGVLWGLAFGLKPQAILFVPLWGYALLSTRPWWRPVVGGAVALAVLLIGASPFILHSGLAWLNRSYVENLFATYSHLTTLKAFNVWYLHLLLSDSLDATVRTLGLSRGMWGKLLLAAGLLAGLLYTWKRWRADRRGLILWTTLSLLLLVMLPTKVHERYLIVVLPFLGVAAARWARLWPSLILLVVVMMAQLSWPMWLRSGRGQWDEIRQDAINRYQVELARLPLELQRQAPDLEEYLAAQRAGYWRLRGRTAAREWTFTIMSLLGGTLVVAGLVSLRPGQPESDAGPGSRSSRCPEPGSARAARRG